MILSEFLINLTAVTNIDNIIIATNTSPSIPLMLNDAIIRYMNDIKLNSHIIHNILDTIGSLKNLSK